MKILIVYATKYGATKEIVGKLEGYLEGDVTTCNIDDKPTIKPKDYDCVIIGSPVVAGAIKKGIKEFAQNNVKELQEKKVGIFVSGLAEDGMSDYLRNNFPKELLATAKEKAFLGGIYDPQKCNFFARMILKAVAKMDKYTNTIDDEKISSFAKNLMM